jgi:hypothetical protein
MFLMRLLIVFLFQCVYVKCELSNADIKLSNLKVEYAMNVVGVEVSSPRLSWTISLESRI